MWRPARMVCAFDASGFMEFYGDAHPRFHAVSFADLVVRAVDADGSSTVKASAKVRVE